MCNDIRFYAGEKKYITVSVIPKNQNDTVVVSSAIYELLREDETVETGECTIDGRQLKILLKIDTCGIYTLKVTVAVGEEIYIQKATVTVKK